MLHITKSLIIGGIALALAGCGAGATTSSGTTSSSSTSTTSGTATSSSTTSSSTSTSDAAATPGQQVAAKDFVTPIRSAVDAEKSYWIQERRSTDPAPSSGSITGAGTDAMAFHMEMPGVMSMRYLDGNAYVLSSDLGPKWVKFRKDSTNPEVQQILSSLTGSVGENKDLEVWETGKVTFVADESVGAHYTVVAPADRFYDATIDEESTTETGGDVNTSADKAKLAGKTVVYDVWLDAKRRPARIKIDSTSLSGLTFSATKDDIVFRSTMTFDKWGEPVAVQVPSAAQTVDADKLAADGAFDSDSGSGQTSAA